METKTSGMLTHEIAEKMITDLDGFIKCKNLYTYNVQFRGVLSKSLDLSIGLKDQPQNFNMNVSINQFDCNIKTPINCKLGDNAPILAFSEDQLFHFLSTLPKYHMLKAYGQQYKDAFEEFQIDTKALPNKNEASLIDGYKYYYNKIMFERVENFLNGHKGAADFLYQNWQEVQKQ